MRKSLTALIFLLLFFLSAGCGREEPAGKRDKGNAWLSFDEGMALAKKEGKPVVLDFYTSWCKWCRVMEEKTFSRPKVAGYLAENFVSIRINAESRSERISYKGRKYTPMELTRKFRIRGYPSLAYLEADGDLITVVPGYIHPERFLNYLKYINKGCYKQQMSFEEFLRKRGEC